MPRLFSIDFTIVPPEKAVVPVMDRGFLYGDSIYEVVRTYEGKKLFLFDRHMTRMNRSAGRIDLKLPFSPESLQAHVEECIQAAGNYESYVRIIVSRGEDDRFNLVPGEHLRSRTVIVVDPLPQFPKSWYEEGIAVIVPQIRRNARNGMDPNIKSGNYLNNVMAILEARKAQASDAFMLNFRDELTEATTSNLYLVRNGTVTTPPEESGLLEGVTRGFLLELMRKRGLPFDVSSLPLSELQNAEEAFISGTIKEIVPVTTIDGKKVGSGRPGPVTKQLIALFRTAVEQELSMVSP